MRKRRRAATTIASRLLRGLGQGEGASWVSWLERRGVPSQGRSTHLPVFDRCRHTCTLSGHERRVALLLGWDGAVIDAREQFPLLPVSRTQVYAAQRGFRHPMEHGHPIERTLDFLVDHALLGRIGLSVKPFDKLDPERGGRNGARAAERQLELLELERAFCSEEGWRWALVSEAEIPLVRATNLDMLNKRWRLSLRNVGPELYDEVGTAIMRSMDRGMSLLEACVAADAMFRFSTEGGEGLAISWNRLARKLWSADLDRPLDPRVTRPRPVPPEDTGWVSALSFYGP